ncbi:MAG: SUMF1/EgtB/PvdO family nonheme iron enzyme [Magnetococcales bacterium]|nr:SUMF1/EgtB/PvdO family nonheme iron enzyme [Magnetococcales bacterium]
MQEMTQDNAQKILSEALPTYHIEKKLGEGSYGAVFLAYDKSTERHYAVKFFRMEVQRAIEGGKLTDATSRLNRDWRLLMDHHERFKTCSALVDIPIFFKVDAQEMVRGQAAAWGIAVMEYFPSNLHDYVLDYMEKNGKPLPSERRLILLQKLAKTLKSLHSITDSDGHPFVYEDLKPENVLVADISSTDITRVVIGDIGGLKRIGGSSLSSGGQITQRYAAPEVLRQNKRVDQQAAVYAFGLIGYFVIEGNIPYDAVSLDERFDLIDAKLDFTPEMLKGLESAGEVIRKCLQSDRQKRFANFEEVSQALSQKEERVGSGPTILPALHHEEPAPTPVNADIKPLSNDKNIVTGSGETIVPVRSPDEEKIKNIQEEKSNDGQNIILQPSSSFVSKKKYLVVASVFGIFLIAGIIISVKDKDNQGPVDSSSIALQAVPPLPKSTDVTQTDKKGLANGNKISAPSGQASVTAAEDEKERQKMEETKRETERLIQEAAKIKRDALEAKRIEAEEELARLREEERLRKEQEAKKREEAELARLREERLRKEQEEKKREEEEFARKEAEKQKNERANSPAAGQFVKVPAGTFKMGCSSWQQDCSKDEKQIHDVRVGEFEIGKYEVTQGQWKEVIGKYQKYNNKKCGDKCPISDVEWNDIQIFIKKLNDRRDGCTYRLPTEAEWEYACRSGGKEEKYCGGGNLDQLAWYDRQEPYNPDMAGPYRVGQKAPNGLGIYDMSGNVWELTSDYYNVPTTDNPHGSKFGPTHVARGGSWIQGRSTSYERREGETGFIVEVGFRLARNCQ